MALFAWFPWSHASSRTWLGNLLGQSAGGHEPAYECKPTFLCRCQPTTFFPIGSPKPLQVRYFCLSEPNRSQGPCRAIWFISFSFFRAKRPSLSRLCFSGSAHTT